MSLVDESEDIGIHRANSDIARHLLDIERSNYPLVVDDLLVAPLNPKLNGLDIKLYLLSIQAILNQLAYQLIGAIKDRTRPNNSREPTKRARGEDMAWCNTRSEVNIAPQWPHGACRYAMEKQTSATWQAETRVAL